MRNRGLIVKVTVVIGIAGIAALGTVGCEKDDDLKTQLKPITEVKHDTVYIDKSDSANSVKPDTIYLPGDTVYLPFDSTMIKSDTIRVPGDTIRVPGDTIRIPGDTIRIPNDTIYLPSKPDPIYTPSKPDTVYLPSKPDTIYTPSKPDTIYTPSKPDTIYTPSKPDTIYLPMQPHSTTYVWAKKDWNTILSPSNTNNVVKSADSTSVSKVVLRNDGTSLGGAYTTSIFNRIDAVIQSVSPENRYKIRGAGTLNDIAMKTPQNVQDSIKLSMLGFSFGNVIYSQDFHR